jgi:hypothetical protein
MFGSDFKITGFLGHDAKYTLSTSCLTQEVHNIEMQGLAVTNFWLIDTFLQEHPI